jgi:hypothetical protein
MEDVTRLTLEQGHKTFSVEMEGSDLEYTEFMDLIEALLTRTKYSKSEIDDYITMWAQDIKSTWEN